MVVDGGSRGTGSPSLMRSMPKSRSREDLEAVEKESREAIQRSRESLASPLSPRLGGGIGGRDIISASPGIPTAGQTRNNHHGFGGGGRGVDSLHLPSAASRALRNQNAAFDLPANVEAYLRGSGCDSESSTAGTPRAMLSPNMHLQSPSVQLQSPAMPVPERSDSLPMAEIVTSNSLNHHNYDYKKDDGHVEDVVNEERTRRMLPASPMSSLHRRTPPAQAASPSQILHRPQPRLGSLSSAPSPPPPQPKFAGRQLPPVPSEAETRLQDPPNSLQHPPQQHSRSPYSTSSSPYYQLSDASSTDAAAAAVTADTVNPADAEEPSFGLRRIRSQSPSRFLEAIEEVDCGGGGGGGGVNGEGKTKGKRKELLTVVLCLQNSSCTCHRTKCSHFMNSNGNIPLRPARML